MIEIFLCYLSSKPKFELLFISSIVPHPYKLSFQNFQSYQKSSNHFHFIVLYSPRDIREKVA